MPSRAEPLSAKQRWQAITVATLLLLPGFWALLTGLVAAADDGSDGPNAATALALGFASLPFVFIALAFLSTQPSPPVAVLKAMGLSLLVGIPVSALAGDAVTGIVAAVGAGGVVSLRADVLHSIKARWFGVAVASAYVFVLVRTAGAIALLPAPVFPLTAIGLADHWSERRAVRA